MTLEVTSTIAKMAIRERSKGRYRPMAWDRQALINLRELLARIYPTERDARTVAVEAGLNTGLISLEGTSIINTWFAILQHADNQDKVDAVVLRALRDHPDNEALQHAVRRAPPRVIAGPEATDWRSSNSVWQLEKIVGPKSTLVPISFLELGVAKARSVAKVRLADGASGSGFLTRNGILITNHHVLPNAAAAGTATTLFNYQQTVAGLSAEADERPLLPDDLFMTSRQDDWTAVRVAGNPGERWGELPLAPAWLQVGNRVNIIQHPAGRHKQISLLFNLVAFIGNNRVQYLTDTEPGSSGSPVFDERWNVVALHHSGGWLPEPGGSDPAKTFYRNEGILIDVIIAGLAAELGAEGG
jgi:Trypsin-like peptidase domain/Effector-associated domain 1